MSFRDYYKILECSPQASFLEIKKSYRALARRYHPDKNGTDPNATKYFQEIQSAYEVLSNPLKRRSYDNDLKLKGQYSSFAKDTINNVEQILKQTQDLKYYISTKQHQGVNSDALVDFILAILNRENIALLLRKNDSEITSQVVNNLISASSTIVSYHSFIQLADRFLLLCPYAGTLLHQKIIEEINLRKQQDKQNKLVPYITFLIVLLVIGLMLLILQVR